MADLTHEYFLELLLEEIPAWMHDSAHAALQQRLEPLVTQLGGDASGICISSTPRRLVLFLPRLPEREADRELEVKGPPKKTAFGPQGEPTQALLGFLRKNNAVSEEIVDSGDEYVRIRKMLAGRAADELIAERVPEMIESLRWPKMMRWGNGEHAYIRPLHSIVSLFDERHLPLTIFGVASGTRTTGHRTLAPQPFEVRSYNDYVSKLELAHVVVDATRRRHVMAERARILANQVSGSPSIDAATWSQWQYLTEYPGVLRTEFRSEYLNLPEEVLVTVMRVHQKQLPVRDAAGSLTSSFLAVLDNEGDPEGNAAYGNAFVTNARFADAQFFYRTDRKRTLSDRLQQLEHLQFQEKLGNYRQKTTRLEGIATAICQHLGIDGNETLTAARLCKADLVTEMVKEFTELQGCVGGLYAREEGYPDEVWQAIYDHYLPLNIDDEVPRTLSGAIVSLSDKIDSLYGFFLSGVRPSGSKDPFALRRAAQGIVQILLNRDKREVRIGIDRLIDLAAPMFGGSPEAQLKTDLLAFFAERVRTLLEGQFAYDEIAAAMEAGWMGSLTDLSDRVAALHAIRDEESFLSVLDSAKRIANITAGHEEKPVDPQRLEHDVEKRLYELSTLVSEQIDELIAARRYRDALQSFAGLAPELESFFREVMVMVDDQSIRSNRMSLLQKIGGAAMKIGDVTRIVVDRRDYRT